MLTISSDGSSTNLETLVENCCGGGGLADFVWFLRLEAQKEAASTIPRTCTRSPDLAFSFVNLNQTVVASQLHFSPIPENLGVGITNTKLMMKAYILVHILALFGPAIDSASSFQPVPFLPRTQLGSVAPRRGRPLHLQELSQLLAIDFGDAVVSAAATVGALIAASIVSREIAAATRAEKATLEPSDRHLLPIPPKEMPSLKLMNLADVKEDVMTMATPDIGEVAPMPAVEVAEWEPVNEQADIDPDMSIVGVPYVADSLVDNVYDFLVAVDESEGLIVDPLVLDDYGKDPVLDNPLLYEGGYFEDEEEELFGVYERVEVDEKEVITEEEFGTYGVANVEVEEKNAPPDSFSESFQTIEIERPVPYLESLAANAMTSDDTPDPTYLEGLSNPDMQEEPLVDQDSIAGVPYVSDSLVDAVEDGLIIVDNEERLTVDPLALSRMNDGDSFVELYEKAETIVAQYDDDPVADDALAALEVDRKEMETPAIAITIPGSAVGSFVEDIDQQSDTVTDSPDQGEQVQLPTYEKPKYANGILRSTNVADIVSLQDTNNMFEDLGVRMNEIPQQQLKLSKSVPVQDPSLQRVQVVDPKLDAVRKHLKEQAINMTNALLQKSEQQPQVMQRTPTNFEEATEPEQFEQNYPSQVMEIGGPSLEKEVEKQTKPLLNLEKGSDKQTLSTTTVISLDKGEVRKRGVLRILRQRKVAIAVGAMAVVVARRIVSTIIGRGML